MNVRELHSLTCLIQAKIVKPDAAAPPGLITAPTPLAESTTSRPIYPLAYEVEVSDPPAAAEPEVEPEPSRTKRATPEELEQCRQLLANSVESMQRCHKSNVLLGTALKQVWELQPSCKNKEIVGIVRTYDLSLIHIPSPRDS